MLRRDCDARITTPELALLGVFRNTRTKLKISAMDPNRDLIPTFITHVILGNSVLFNVLSLN